jgi:hypothetical protein
MPSNEKRPGFFAGGPSNILGRGIGLLELLRDPSRTALLRATAQGDPSTREALVNNPMMAGILGVGGSRGEGGTFTPNLPPMGENSQLDQLLRMALLSRRLQLAQGGADAGETFGGKPLLPENVQIVPRGGRQLAQVPGGLIDLGAVPRPQRPQRLPSGLVSSADLQRIPGISSGELQAIPASGYPGFWTIRGGEAPSTAFRGAEDVEAALTSIRSGETTGETARGLWDAAGRTRSQPPWAAVSTEGVYDPAKVRKYHSRGAQLDLQEFLSQ